MNYSEEIATYLLPTSKKRALCIVVFGFITSLISIRSFEEAIVYGLISTLKISKEAAEQIYLSHNLSVKFCIVAGATIGALMSSYTARRKGVLISLFANLPLVGIYLWLDNREGILGVSNSGDQLTRYLPFCGLLIMTTVVAGLIGQFISLRYYPFGWEVLESNPTILGIRWYHYLWILPLFFLQAGQTFLMVTSAVLTTVLTDLYSIVNPACWSQKPYWYHLLLNSPLMFLTVGITRWSIVGLRKSLPQKQAQSGVLKTIWNVILYGVIALSVAYFLAGWSIDLAVSLPKPNWSEKIELVLIVGYSVLSLLLLIFWATHRLPMDREQWTTEEIDKYLLLRALEWESFPEFISIGLGQLLLLMMTPLQAIAITVTANITWRFISSKIIDVRIADYGVWLNNLKWISSPIVACIFIIEKRYALAATALVWPIIIMVATFVPGVLLGKLLGGDAIGVGEIQQQMLSQMKRETDSPEMK